MELDDVKPKATQLSPWALVTTVGAYGMAGTDGWQA